MTEDPKSKPGASRTRTRKRVAVRATFPELRPAHANLFTGTAVASSVSAGIGRSMREVMKRLREARKAKRVRGRVQTIKLTVSISPANEGV